MVIQTDQGVLNNNSRWKYDRDEDDDGGGKERVSYGEIMIGNEKVLNTKLEIQLWYDLMHQNE